MKLRNITLYCGLFITVFANGANTYTNPVILPSNYGMTTTADPFVFKDSNGIYYCYVTGKGFPVFLSKDLVKWAKASSNSFPSSNYKWATDNFWAPEIVKSGNMYYMHYTGKDSDGIMKIGMAKSSSPLGPFEDVSDKPFLDRDDKSSIDSHIFFDDDGKAYMYFANDMSTNYVTEIGKKRSEIWVIEVKPDLSDTIGTAKMLFYPTQDWEYSSSNSSYWNEAPTMIKRNGIYYLMYSANCYCSNYSVGYAIARSPMGPFTKYSQNPILAGVTSYVSGPGHHSIVMSPDNSEMICVYHSHVDLVEQGGKRMVNIDRMGFTSNGILYINGPTYTPQDYPSSVVSGVEYSTFNGSKLEIAYNPATNQINLNVPINSSKISIYNTYGVLVYSILISEDISKLNVPVDKLHAGMYILRLENRYMNAMTGKFIKK